MLRKALFFFRVGWQGWLRVKWREEWKGLEGLTRASELRLSGGLFWLRCLRAISPILAIHPSIVARVSQKGVSGACGRWFQYMGVHDLVDGTSIPLPATEQSECLRCDVISPMTSKMSPARFLDGEIRHIASPARYNPASPNKAEECKTIQRQPSPCKDPLSEARPPKPVHREVKKGKQRADRKACRVM